MTNYTAFPARRPSMAPLLFAGASFALASFLVLDRVGVFQREPSGEPRAITPRGDLTAIEKTFTEIFAERSPSVVHLTTEKLARTWRGDVRSIPEGTGTGFLWDDTGIVVTNYHVVQTVVEQQSRLKVALGDELHDGTVVGVSPDDDIAVVRIVAPPRDLAPLPIGTSADLKVGQTVLAIGNPYGFDRSLSTGIISALDRSIDTKNSSMNGLIQTDAAINPGNSGGPLLDSAGRLIGMNTAIYSPSGTSAGIGFAVPVDRINEVVPALIDGRQAQRTLGLKFDQPIRIDTPEGLRVGLPVIYVERGSGAEQAGMQPFARDRGQLVWGDTIVAVDGTAVRSTAEVVELLRGRKRGEEVPVTVVRGKPGESKVLTLPVALK
ncbi:MAG: trypsin-like peptidase domain-containing protein [Planctomycetes bacterium]|nr:trypsin-like peptidase domain-containing protein [Planctomycetota bacterium]